MNAKITVNGVTYGSVDAMPPDVRKTYQQLMAKLPALGATDTVPEVAEGDLGPLHWRTSVQKKFVIGGKTYENEAAIPADVRQSYDQAMRAAKSNDPNVEKNEIKLSFQITGPNFTFRKGTGQPRLGAPSFEPVAGLPEPTPIEPDAEGRLRKALFLGICIGAAVVLYIYLRTS